MKETSTDAPCVLELPDGPRLHIGGLSACEGWLTLNIQPLPGVDFVGDVRNISRITGDTFQVVYCSHVLEHLGYQHDLLSVLEGIHRVLAPGGSLLVSVPDLDTLCRLFVDPDSTPDERFFVMRMMFGGQIDSHDFHCVGLTDEILTHYLHRAGFRRVQRVQEFKLFRDASSLRFKGSLISLNAVAFKARS